jgi:hypothetical protein
LKIYKLMPIVVLTAILFTVGGAYGGIYLDRSWRDPFGLNLVTGEVAVQLKFKAASLILLKRNDLSKLRTLLVESIKRELKAAETMLDAPTINGATKIRMNASIRLAQESLSSSDPQLGR